MSDTRDILDGTLTEMVEKAAVADLPELAGALASAQARVLARIAAGEGANRTAPAPEVSDGLLTVDQAAERLGVPKTWLYRHSAALPFARKLGHRTLRFDAGGLNRWAKNRPSA